MARTEAPNFKRLRRDLRLFDVYAIATGATLSAGFFLLPGLAAEQVGPAVVLCYMLAVVPLVPAMLCVVELATAMPKAGGAYYFLDRSLGPLMGTIGGIGTWLALTLKGAFALVGMGFYLEIFFSVGAEDMNVLMKVIGVSFALFFGLVNFLGAKKSGRFQIVLVVVLLALLAGFVLHGVFKVETSHFQGFFAAGNKSIIAMAGTVYISYVGVTNVASISGEVHDPERNLPWGVFLALGTAIAIYGLGTLVMVGVVPQAELQGNPTLVATAAGYLAGKWGTIAMSIAALIAFASVANAAILGSSRYPLAMSRDHLLPTRLRALGKRGTPGYSILITVAAIIAFVVFFDPLQVAKLASAFQLLIFSLLCVAVIVMRESKLDSYDPGYKAPFYPWLQIFGFLAPLVLITQMGWLSTLFTSGVIAIGVGWYFGYARHRVERHGAIYHVFERLGRRRFDPLDTELRGILKEKGLRADDPFDEVVARAEAIDLDVPTDFGEVVLQASDLLAKHLPRSAEELALGFLQGTRVGATPVSGGVALPHLRVSGVEVPILVLVRSRDGVQIDTGDALSGSTHEEIAHAIFFLVSPEDDPGQHLRLLAQLAGRVDQDEFANQWQAAADIHALKETLLRNERYITLHLLAGRKAEALAGRAVRHCNLPAASLVVLVSRAGQTVVPDGAAILEPGDRITIIGTANAIATLYTLYSDDHDRSEAPHQDLPGEDLTPLEPI